MQGQLAPVTQPLIDPTLSTQDETLNEPPGKYVNILHSFNLFNLNIILSGFINFR